MQCCITVAVVFTKFLRINVENNVVGKAHNVEDTRNGNTRELGGLKGKRGAIV